MTRARTSRQQAQFLIEAQRLDIAADFLQRVNALPQAGRRRVADEVVEAFLAHHDDEVRDAVRQPQPHDDRIAAQEIGIHQVIGRQVLVHVANAVGRKRGRSFPTQIVVFVVAAVLAQEDVQAPRVGVDPVELHHHRGRGQGAADLPERVYRLTQLILPPHGVALQVQGNR